MIKIKILFSVLSITFLFNIKIDAINSIGERIDDPNLAQCILSEYNNRYDPDIDLDTELSTFIDIHNGAQDNVLSCRDISTNNIVGIDFISGTALKAIDLAKNKIEEVDLGLFHDFTYLDDLFFQYNNISEIYNLNQLNIESICLDHNKLTKLPDDIEHQSSLTFITLDHNKIDNLTETQYNFLLSKGFELGYQEATKTLDDGCLDKNYIIDSNNLFGIFNNATILNVSFTYQLLDSQGQDLLQRNLNRLGNVTFNNGVITIDKSAFNNNAGEYTLVATTNTNAVFNVPCVYKFNIKIIEKSNTLTPDGNIPPDGNQNKKDNNHIKNNSIISNTGNSQLNNVIMLSMISILCIIGLSYSYYHSNKY